MWNSQFINEVTAPGHRWKVFLPGAAVTEPQERAVLSPAVLFARKWLRAAGKTVAVIGNTDRLTLARATWPSKTLLLE